MTVSIAVFNAHRKRRARKEEVARSVRMVLLGEARRAANISVVLVGDPAMAGINRRFLSHRGTTDVISFPLEEGANLEGEIYVNLDMAARQAREYRVSMSSEIARLVIHGTLHLAGYDDRRTSDARRMKRQEDRYVEEFLSRRTKQG